MSYTFFRERGNEKLVLDLSLLRPLWGLYQKMSSCGVEAGSVVSPVVRALTEFFLIAENLAMVIISLSVT